MSLILDGLIIKGIGGFYYVETSNGVFECKARGSFRRDGISPLVGDYVQIAVTDNSENRLEQIYPRTNSLVRPPIANLDQLFIIASLADPAPNLFVIDKQIAVAQHKQIEPILVFNKTDLGDPTPLRVLYEQAGFQVVVTTSGDATGYDKIRLLLKGKTSAFTGNSGVGKSTILNELDAHLALPTGEISKKLGRGRHTTRHAELFRVAEGYVADTAGFSSIELERCERILKEELPDCFREFIPYLGKCQFTSCAHIRDKGCAVLAAVEEGKIARSRHESYQELYEQVKDVKQWNNK